ncbi:MAG: exo-alpha-sialidase [Acidobacteriia bacterium]|nr:exo-alpha-sialidase [Terriglobia bacterium]
MSRISRVAWCFIFALTLTLLLTPVLNAQQRLEKSPLSGGLLAARAFKEGRLHYVPATGANQHVPDLTCTPAPCAFPNVDAAEGGSAPSNEHPFAANPKNAMQLLTGANDYNCGNVQGYYASSDGGSTWTRVCSPGSGGEGDPVTGYDLNNVAYAGGIQSGQIVAFISTDNGSHWGSPIKVIGAQLGYTADKPWMEIDTTKSSRKNTIYISSTQFDSSSNSQIWVSHSTDGGHTWASVAADALQHYPTAVDQFSDLAIGADGTVYLSWIRCPANGPTGDCGSTKTPILLSKSTDGGTTWSAPVTVATITMVPDSCGAFYGCLPNTFERVSNIPSNAVSGSGATAKVYVIFYNWTGTQMQVEVATSTNGGSTFGAPVRVTNAKNDEFFPWINLASNGKIAATWLDRRNDATNLSYQPFLAITSNPASFGASHALSSTKSNPNNDGFGGGFFGDYRTHVWDGHAIYANWCDTRTGTCQCEVGGAQTP